jgi:hypothetical protein
MSSAFTNFLFAALPWVLASAVPLQAQTPRDRESKKDRGGRSEAAQPREAPRGPASARPQGSRGESRAPALSAPPLPGSNRRGPSLPAPALPHLDRGGPGIQLPPPPRVERRGSAPAPHLERRAPEHGPAPRAFTDRRFGFTHPPRDHNDREGFRWVPGRGHAEGRWAPFHPPSRHHVWIPGHWRGDVWINGHWSLRHRR